MMVRGILVVRGRDLVMAAALLRLGFRPAIHVRSSPNTDHKFIASAFLFDYLIGAGLQR
jgi:hypothetical protein